MRNLVPPPALPACLVLLLGNRVASGVAQHHGVVGGAGREAARGQRARPGLADGCPLLRVGAQIRLASSVQ